MRHDRKSKNCGDCRFWVRRGGAWGNCHRHAPEPYIPGSVGEKFAQDWEATLGQQMDAKSRGESTDWAPPRGWEAVWPDTKATDFCGDWKAKLRRE